MGHIVYVCHTPYHLLIASVKALKDQREADVVLVDTIPDVDALSHRVEQSGLFAKVKVVGVGRPFRSSSFYRTWLFGYVNKKQFVSLLNYFKGCKDIYLFNDISEVGCLLMKGDCRYHLIEDGLDTFKIYDQNNNPSGNALARGILSRVLGLPVGLASSPLCIDVEVNDANDLRTAVKRPLIESPRSVLFGSLGSTDIEVLFAVFDFEVPSGVDLSDAVLILTTPFREMGYSVTQIIDYYSKLISEMTDSGVVYIKPHPRDTIDYSALVDSSRILDKNAPSELFSLNPMISFGTVVAYASTSLGSFKSARRRCVTRPGLTINGIDNLNIEIVKKV